MNPHKNLSFAMKHTPTTLVRDLMTTQVVFIRPDDSLLTAARRMHEENITCVVVDLGDAARGFGILTQKDIVQRLADTSLSLPATSVRTEMSYPCVCVPAHYDVATALGMMRMVGVRRAPVLEGERVVGVLSFTDIFRWQMGQLEQAAA